MQSAQATREYQMWPHQIFQGQEITWSPIWSSHWEDHLHINCFFLFLIFYSLLCTTHFEIIIPLKGCCLCVENQVPAQKIREKKKGERRKVKRREKKWGEKEREGDKRWQKAEEKQEGMGKASHVFLIHLVWNPPVWASQSNASYSYVDMKPNWFGLSPTKTERERSNHQ